jgi:uncharacterized protein YecT (DUF1311 family)
MKMRFGMSVLTAMLMTTANAAAPAGAAMQGDVTTTFSSAYPACITYGERHNTTAIPEGECNARELRVQDARLNAAYKGVISRLSPVRKADLRTDERNWIRARDARCGKQPDPDLKTECTINETIKRIAYLRRYR